MKSDVLQFHTELESINLVLCWLICMNPTIKVFKFVTFKALSWNIFNVKKKIIETTFHYLFIFFCNFYFLVCFQLSF